MKNNNELLKKLSILTFIMFLSVAFSYGQTYVLSGEQVRGVSGQNAKLSSKAVVINKTVKIYSVVGNNAGFWIANANSVAVKKYWNTNDPSAVGLTLAPGTYYIYPNLKPNQNKATITIKLK